MPENHSDNRSNKPWYQRGWLRTFGVVLLFLVLSLVYFSPAAFEGRKLFQVDGAGALGQSRDVKVLEEQTGHQSLWTGNLFGGMPTYQISPSYPSTRPVKFVQKLYQLQEPLPILIGDSYLVFILLIGFYILMRSFGYKRLLSLTGALMWAFSSYFLILIDAGHIWKLLTLAYIPPTLAGLVWIFKRKKYLLGTAITSVFATLQIYSNHIQMSYYFAFVMLALVIGWSIEFAKQKEYKHIWISLGSLSLAGLLAIAINGTNLYHTYEYSQSTMRGGSTLTTSNGDSGKDNRKGLEKEYITQWSYGIGETLTLLIPNARGGATGRIGHDEEALSKVSSPQAKQFIAEQNRYWGDQPFTAGPVYVGAFVLFLAIFGILVTRGAVKWGLLIVTVLTIMLSWGHNLMWLSDLFIDYVPLYNKFRTVSSILVVAEFTIPLFACWGLWSIIHDPDIVTTKKKAFGLAALLTGGVSLVLYLFPTLAGSFTSKVEQSFFQQYTNKIPDFALLISSLESVRQTIFRADALRSLVIILIGIGLIWLFVKKHLPRAPFIGLTALLILIDLWSVDKRYLNDSKYLPEQKIAQMIHTPTPIDQEILKDPIPYRVMNLTVDTFNDATTSYLHRSVGGYHAAKLQRYQDVIQGYLSKQNRNVLRALNTRYYIVPDSLGQASLVEDNDCYGQAWYVASAYKVKNADEEFKAIGDLPLDQIAVVAPPFDSMVPTQLPADGKRVIQATSYSPDKLTYISSSTQEGLAVFSEIFYGEGWHATIDGQEAPILRVDYLLRGLLIPPGEHTIVFEFRPKSVQVTEAISFASSTLLLLIICSLIALYAYKHHRSKGS